MGWEKERKKRSELKRYEHCLMMEYFNAYAFAFFYCCSTSAMETFCLRCCVNILRCIIKFPWNIFFFSSKVISAPNKTIKFHFPKFGLLNVECACICMWWLDGRRACLRILYKRTVNKHSNVRSAMLFGSYLNKCNEKLMSCTSRKLKSV